MKKAFGIFKNELFRIISGALFFIPAILLENFEYGGLALSFYILALLCCGSAVFLDAVKGILRKDLLDEKFLMSIASIGAMIIGERAEGVAVMLFFLVGEYFEHKAVKRSRKSIKDLMDIRPDTARVIYDEEEEIIDAEDVEVDDTIVLYTGERVPVDCVVCSGSAYADTSALTGDSVPAEVSEGSEIASGTVILNGVLKCKALRSFDESCASRILELVENAAENKSKEEAFITKFSRVYTPIVTGLALAMAILAPLLFSISFKDGIYRALSFLVVSCPCALVISVPLAFFGGIGGAASRGILFKGGNSFAPIARIENAVFDKTGTLTTGKFLIERLDPVGISEDELLKYAASLERYSNHPIALCISSASQEKQECTDVKEIAGKGLIAILNGENVAVGNRSLQELVGVKDLPEDDAGKVFVSVNGIYRGAVSVRDVPRDEAKSAISHLRLKGVKKTYILSGDGEKSVSRVAKAVGVDEHYSKLLPEDKYNKLKNISESSKGSTVYVGDGINDAPCIAYADVGIAMGGIGSDSAIEAADLIIMSDNLMKIPEAVGIARRTLNIAKGNIVFAIGVKVIVLGLVSLNFVGMWGAVFADVGVAVLAILNSMRTLFFGRRNNA